jgi:carbonic anhydrase/acetyltransferase-like protein (isoleucine patch superfamily)
MPLRPYGDKRPALGKNVYVDESALVIGDVQLGDGVTVWPGAVLRADDDRIVIGRGSAVMDMAFAEAPQGRPVTVGEGSILSHAVRLHGCSIGRGVLVGVGAIVLDESIVGDGSVVAAGTLITPGSNIPDGSVVMGSPGKVTGKVSESNRAWLVKELQALSKKADVYGRGRRTP